MIHHIKVHVKTDCKEEKVNDVNADLIEIELREPREDNRANDRILEILRNMFPNCEIKIINGHHSDHKIVGVAMPK